MELNFSNMCIKDLKKKSPKTLAIIGVHCFGIADISSLVSYVKNFLIEDACLNGGKLNQKYYGEFGDASIMSFDLIKFYQKKGH